SQLSSDVFCFVSSCTGGGSDAAGSGSNDEVAGAGVSSASSSASNATGGFHTAGDSASIDGSAERSGRAGVSVSDGKALSIGIAPSDFNQSGPKEKAPVVSFFLSAGFCVPGSVSTFVWADGSGPTIKVSVSCSSNGDDCTGTSGCRSSSLVSIPSQAGGAGSSVFCSSSSHEGADGSMLFTLLQGSTAGSSNTSMWYQGCSR